MSADTRNFYGRSALPCKNAEAVMRGAVIKINPALITLTDGLQDTHAPEALRRRVWEAVELLVAHKIRTFHLDINFGDYSGFGPEPPTTNAALFTPGFVKRLNALIRSHDAFLNLHLLTDHPGRRFRDFAHLTLGAICFQLDAIPNARSLSQLMQEIQATGACASPVIETLGTPNLVPRPAPEVFDVLQPVLPMIEMLTFQTAGTGSRSGSAAGTFAPGRVQTYLDLLGRYFQGTLQFQGGITTSTIGEAVTLGAEFLVCGTQIFRHRAGLSPTESVDLLLAEAASALCNTTGATS